MTPDTEMEWTDVADSDLGGEEMARVLVKGLDIALYRSEGCLYATSNTCTHGQAILTDGWLEDGIIECPLHGGRFEVATGRGLGAPIEHDLRCYGVREIDGRIEIAIQKDAE